MIMLKRVLLRKAKLAREEKLRRHQAVLVILKDLAASTLTAEEFKAMVIMEECADGHRPMEEINNSDLLVTVKVLQEALKISQNLDEMTPEDYNIKLRQILIENSLLSSEEDPTPVDQCLDETIMDIPEVKVSSNESKANFGKDFARGDHPSRSGATYCAAAESEERTPKRWNGPGSKMLPPVYGESLHNHKKFVNVNEDWEEPKKDSKKQDDTGTSTSYRSGNYVSLQSVPLYVAEENQKEYTEEEKRLTDVAKMYSMYQRSTSINDKRIYWIRFRRPDSEKVETVFLVILNGSHYLWFDWLSSNYIEIQARHFPPLLKNLTNADDVKSKLAEMLKLRLEDFNLTSLSNYGRVRGIDDDLAAVLEVSHYNWKHPQFKIQFEQ